MNTETATTLFIQLNASQHNPPHIVSIGSNEQWLIDFLQEEHRRTHVSWHFCVCCLCCTLKALSLNELLSGLNFIVLATLYCSLSPFMQAESVNPGSYLQMLSVKHALRDLGLFLLSFVFLSPSSPAISLWSRSSWSRSFCSQAQRRTGVLLPIRSVNG